MNYLDLADRDVLDLCGDFGPGMVGAYLFERAEWIRQHNPLGAMGRDAMDKQYEPSDAAMADLEARKMVQKVVFEKEPEDAVLEYAGLAPVKRGPGRPRKEK
jgi:hypothetical protein